MTDIEPVAALKLMDVSDGAGWDNTMQFEHKSAFQLEQMIAELTGFDAKIIDVTKVGNSGDFSATLIGTVAAVSKSRAQSDVDAACRQLKLKFKLKA